MVFTREMRIIHDHTGLSFKKIDELDIRDYKLYLRDGFIMLLEKTDGGREYLEKCYLFEQTEPDRQSLRQFKKEV